MAKIDLRKKSDEKIPEFKKASETKEQPKKVAKSNLVDFLVKVPFNGYKRGSIKKGVERTKAAKWQLKERGEIL